MDFIKVLDSKYENSAAHWVLIKYHLTGSYLVLSESRILKETMVFPAVVFRNFNGRITDWTISSLLEIYCDRENAMPEVLRHLNSGQVTFKRVDSRD